MNKNKISVIMPVYNAEKYIKQAIDSILNQTYTNFELIIIDDCPIDNTMEIISQYKDDRIHILHNTQNSGIAYSRNRGLDYSSGEYIALMDHDDISLPRRFELQIDFLKQNKDYDVVGGRRQVIDSVGKLIRPSTTIYFNPLYIKARLLFKNVYVNSSVMLRKKLIDIYSLRYQEGFLGMEDFRFWIDCSKVGKMGSVDDILLLYRDTEENETSRIRNEFLDERIKLYAEIQRYSLYQSGFRLKAEELNVITKVLKEQGGKCDSKQEIEEFYLALLEIIHQAREMQCDNYKEIEIFCRHLFGEKLRMTDILWE